MPLYSEDYIQSLHDEVTTYPHPSGVKARIVDELTDIDEKVLETAVRSLNLPEATDVQDDLVRISVDDKMAFNGITNEGNKKIIYASLCYSELVGEYIKQRAIDDNDKSFPYRLKAYFKSLYAQYYNNQFYGDALFDRLVVAVINDITTPAYYNAAFAIIVHLFEICDLFERHDITN